MEQELTSAQNTQTIFRYDCLRSMFWGIVEAGLSTFVLLIAIRVYDAPEWVKSIIVSAGFIGLMLNSVSVSWASRLKVPSGKMVARYFFATATFLFLSSISSHLAVYAALIFCAHIACSQQAPLITHMLTENYSTKERGRRVASLFMIVPIAGMLASFTGGQILDWNLDFYPLVLLMVAVACIGYALVAQKIPSKPLDQAETNSPWDNISLIWKDGLFGWMLLCWMLLGFSNLMTLPLRVEYLAQPEYGINATNSQIALITVIIPATARLVSVRIWGILFDRMHFITWRNATNCCFAISMVTYFNAENLIWLGVGSAFLGFGMGGGAIGWSLWVTKIAPREKVPAYMSIHTASTGLRGTLAPFVGYALLSGTSASTVGNVSFVLTIVASFMFALARNSKRFN